MIDELPIGPGQARRQWRPLEAVDELDDERSVEPGASLGSPGTGSLVVELPTVEVVKWDARKLRAPLKVFGSTVNWQIRRRLQLDTDAGRMTDDNFQDIGEPLAEIANRYEPTRALAARSTELALVMAIYDYVQETAVKAGHAKQLVIDAERIQARTVEADALGHLASIDEEDQL